MSYENYVQKGLEFGELLTEGRMTQPNQGSTLRKVFARLQEPVAEGSGTQPTVADLKKHSKALRKRFDADGDKRSAADWKELNTATNLIKKMGPSTKPGEINMVWGTLRQLGGK